MIDELEQRGHHDQANALRCCPLVHAYRDLRDADVPHDTAIEQLAEQAPTWRDAIESTTGRSLERLHAADRLEDTVDHLVSRWMKCDDCGQVAIPDLSRLRLCPGCMELRRAKVRARYTGPILDGLMRAVELAGPARRLRHTVLTLRNPPRDELDAALDRLGDARDELRDTPVSKATDAIGTWDWYDRERRARQRPEHEAHHGCSVCSQGHEHRDSDCPLEDPTAHRPITWDELLDAWIYSVEENHRPQDDTWNVHMHLVAVAPYIPQPVLKHAWFQVTGDSDIVWISQVGDPDEDDTVALLDAVEDVTKYAAKIPSPLPRETVEIEDLDADDLAMLARERAEILVDWWEATRDRRRLNVGGWIHGLHRLNELLLRGVAVAADDDGGGCPRCGADLVPIPDLDRPPPWQSLPPPGSPRPDPLGVRR